MQDPALLRKYPLTSDDFPELFHRLIYAAITNLIATGTHELDAVTVDEYLSHYDTQYAVFRKYDGLHYLESVKKTAKAANIDHNYSQVRKFSLLRRYRMAGIDVSEIYDPDCMDPDEQEEKRRRFDALSVTEIINHFQLKLVEIVAPFRTSENRDSKKAGVGGEQRVDDWKKSVAWGLSYASGYLTTILHGMRPGTFTIRSGGTGTGKTRLALADLAFACSPYFWVAEEGGGGYWSMNPHGTDHGALYIGTEMELLNAIDPILWANIAGVPEDHIKYAAFEEGEEERVRKTIRMLEQDANIWLEYLPDFTVGAIADVIEQHVLRHNVEYVFFDYIHATPELLAEFGNQSHARMSVREDQVLLQLSTKLKQMARDYGISLISATQVTGEFRNENYRDQTIVAGAKSIINKADNAMIISRPVPAELKKVEPIIRKNGIHKQPNLICSVYKVRDGQYTNVKVWLYVDYATMRMQDLFVTDYTYKQVPEIGKAYIDIIGGANIGTGRQYYPVEDIPVKREQELEF